MLRPGLSVADQMTLADKVRNSIPTPFRRGLCQTRSGSRNPAIPAPSGCPPA
jgi:hypothetical protein